MKNHGMFKSITRISKLAGLTVALAAALCVSTVQAAVNSAVIRTVRGTVQVSDGGGEMKPAKVGMRLKANSVIKTSGPESQADLFLNQNGPIVRVRADTQMGIGKLEYEESGVETVIETQLDLQSGRILGNVKKLASASKYEVKTPKGVAAVRGTDFDISSDGTVTVISGRVDVVYTLPDGTKTTSQAVVEGQTITPPIAGQTVGSIKQESSIVIINGKAEIVTVLKIVLTPPTPPTPGNGGNFVPPPPPIPPQTNVVSNPPPPPIDPPQTETKPN